MKLAALTEEIQWLYLTCDLPAPPLYPDELRENIIPQVPFATLLAKFNGVTEKEYKTYKDNTIKCFQLTHLPPFIICYFKVSWYVCFKNWSNWCWRKAHIITYFAFLAHRAVLLFHYLVIGQNLLLTNSQPNGPGFVLYLASTL